MHDIAHSRQKNPNGKFFCYFFDFFSDLLMNETSKTAYLIELKGSDLVKAASQLEATENALRSQLVEYQLQYRIVANKCKTQEIHSSAYRKYQIRWKSRLLQKTGYIEEKI